MCLLKSGTTALVHTSWGVSQSIVQLVLFAFLRPRRSFLQASIPDETSQSYAEVTLSLSF